MASLTHIASYTISCAFARETNEPKIELTGYVRKQEISSLAKTKVLTHSQNNGVASQVATNGTFAIEQSRQNIPTKKQLFDPYRQGQLAEEGVRYKQTVVIRSYEIGQDKTATVESIISLLQETALNHMWMLGLLGDGFGATHGMTRYNLIWVLSKMQLQVDHYPIWGEVIEIDTWVGASGKNRINRDWLIRSHASGVVYARATSTWAMMNKQTRRLSKVPDEVRREISPWFIEKRAIKEDTSEKIEKLDDKAKYVVSDLKATRSDLDMNNHVNNVKYVKWMLEAIPGELQASHQLSSIVVEYKRECGSSVIVESLCEPYEAGIQQDGAINYGNIKAQNRFSFTSNIFDDSKTLGCFEPEQFKYTHLLKIKGDEKNEGIVRGRTSWKQKNLTAPLHTKIQQTMRVIDIISDEDQFI